MKKRQRLNIESNLLRLAEKQEVLEGHEINFVYKQIHNKKGYIRSRAVECFEMAPFTEKMEKSLYELTFDRDELVRICATEQLQRGKSFILLERLKQLIHDPSYLVRGYAVSSLFYVYINREGYQKKAVEEYLKAVKLAEQEEKNSWVKESYIQNRYLCGESQALDELGQLIMKAEDNTYREVHKGIHILEELRTAQNRIQIDKLLRNILDKIYMPDYLYEEAESIMQQNPVNSVLVVDQENDFFTQMIECVGNEESTLCIESAGIQPSKDICEKAIRYMKDIYHYDIRKYQYPKEISQLWRYSFVIPVGIKLKDEEYPYQVVLHKYEDLKINEESMVEDVKRLVKEIEKRATQDSGLNSNDTI